MSRLTIILFLAAAVAGASCSVPWGHKEGVTTRVEPVPSPSPEKPRFLDFMATAYTAEGTTASGKETEEGIVAADPRVLPLGSRIRVSGAGHRSGVYRVKDTGRKINGHEIDIFIADDAEAKRFGRKPVKVEILHDAARR